MIRKKSLKVSVCLTLILLIVMTVSGPIALASDSKVITITVAQSATCPESAIVSTMQAVMNSKYYYDDGTYKGTLNFVSYRDFTATYLYTDEVNHLRFFRYTWNTTFTGTVTSY